MLEAFWKGLVKKLWALLLAEIADLLALHSTNIAGDDTGVKPFDLK